MKKLYRIAAIICLICTLFLFFGCNRTSADDIYEQLLRATEETNETAEPFAERIYIIIPQTCSGELSLRVGALSEKIRQKTGIDTVVKYDHEKLTLRSGEVEMLIGMTCRTESAEAFALLRSGDYICRWERGKIIIGGRYEEATVSALDAFEQNVLTGASPASLMGKNVDIKNKKEYELSAVTLNGYDLYDFTIVYAEGEGCEAQMAETIRRMISAKSGYWPEILPASKISSIKEKIISVGDALLENDKAPQGAFIEPNGNNITVYGENEYALSVAVESFLSSLLKKQPDGTGSFAPGERVTLQSERPYELFAAVHALHSHQPQANTVYEINRMVHESGGLPVVVKLSAAVWDELSVSLVASREYVKLDENAENGDRTYLIYDPQIFAEFEYGIVSGVLCADMLTREGKSYRLLYAEGSKCTEAKKMLSLERQNAVILYDPPEGFETDASNVTCAGKHMWSAGGTEHGIYVFADAESITNGSFVSASGSPAYAGIELNSKYCPAFAKLCQALQ